MKRRDRRMINVYCLLKIHKWNDNEFGANYSTQKCIRCGKYRRKKILEPLWYRSDINPKKDGYYLLKYPIHIPGCYRYYVEWWSLKNGWNTDTHDWMFWTSVPDLERDKSVFP